MSVSHIATDVGDLSCVTAVAAVVAFWCWVCVGRFAAVLFAMAYLAVLLAVAGLKLVSADLLHLPMAQRISLLDPSRGAPSGHTAMSVFVYGAIGYFCKHARRRWQMVAAPLACAVVVAAVAVTRVTLHTHTLADVVAGFSVGGVILAGLILFLRRLPRSVEVPVGWLVVGLAATNVIMLISGVRVDNDLGLF